MRSNKPHKINVWKGVFVTMKNKKVKKMFLLSEISQQYAKNAISKINFFLKIMFILKISAWSEKVLYRCDFVESTLIANSQTNFRSFITVTAILNSLFYSPQTIIQYSLIWVALLPKAIGLRRTYWSIRLKGLYDELIWAFDDINGQI